MEKLSQAELDRKIHAFLQTRFEAHPDIEALEGRKTNNVVESLQAFIKKAFHKNLPQQAS